MQICLQINEAYEVRLMEMIPQPGTNPLKLEKRLLAGPRQLDRNLFASGGTLNSEHIHENIFQNGGNFLETGKALFEALLQGDVLEKWKNTREKWKTEVDVFDQTASSGSRPILRTYLCIQNKELAAVPWELLYDETSLFWIQGRPCLRCSVPEPVPRESEPQLQIRVLLVNAADDKDDLLKAADEVAGVKTILAKAEFAYDFETMEQPPSIQELEKRIHDYKPHILHFIGHSKTEPGQDPQLSVWDGMHYHPWTRTQILAFLQGIPTLRLCYLNACRTQSRASGSSVSRDSLTEAFLDRSLAVIAMHGEVSGKAAALCAKVFYEGLVGNLSIDQALGNARRAVENQFKGPDPYFPVLTVRTVPEHVLSLKPGPKTPNFDVFGSEVSKNVVPMFVNHRPRRRELAGYLSDRGESGRQAILVTGEDGVGKTWLIKWTLFALALRGFRVHYVEPSQENWLEVLRQIRDRGRNELSQGGCTTTEQSHFNWMLRHLATGSEPPLYQDVIQPDTAGPLQGILANPPVNNFDERICKEMKASLLRGAGEGLILALDHWNLADKGIAHPNFQPIYRHLLQPLVKQQGELRVRIILSVKGPIDNDDFSDWEMIKVPSFDPPELAELAVELLKRMYGPKAIQSSIDLVRKKSDRRMPARELYENLKALGRLLDP